MKNNTTYATSEMKMFGLIISNPTILQLLEHFEIDFTVKDKTLKQICLEKNINEELFVLLTNFYNGFQPETIKICKKDLETIINFLRNSHIYYKNLKYPEIIDFIKQLFENTKNDEVKLIEKFCIDYFNEVIEHFDYEEQVVFPYCENLIQQNSDISNSTFSAKDYREHHTDIETKLSDLKNLLLKHITIEGELPLRRKIIYAINEVEFDLNIHSIIEEKILLPLIEKIENE